MSPVNDGDFFIPVEYKGQSLQIPAVLQAYGYTHRIAVVIDEVELFLEPDEERNYRAVLAPDQQSAASQLDPELIGLVVASAESLFK